MLSRRPGQSPSDNSIPGSLPEGPVDPQSPFASLGIFLTNDKGEVRSGIGIKVPKDSAPDLLPMISVIGSTAGPVGTLYVGHVAALPYWVSAGLALAEIVSVLWIFRRRRT